MIILKENKPVTPAVNPISQKLNEQFFKEASNLPDIAKVGGVATNSPIFSVQRQSNLLATLQAAGYDAYVNKMNNVVCPTKTMADASAVLQYAYEAFGVQGNAFINFTGQEIKLYFDPRQPQDKAKALSYAKAVGLPPPSTRYLA
jgi:hypothetical protein